MKIIIISAVAVLLNLQAFHGTAAQSSNPSTPNSSVLDHSSPIPRRIIFNFATDHNNCIFQLKSADKQISQLHAETGRIYGTLEQCLRGSSVSTDIRNELVLLRKKYSASQGDYGRLQTELYAARSDAQSWRSQFDVINHSFSQCEAKNTRYQFSYKELQTTFAKCQTKLEEYSGSNKHCGTEATEYKRKYENERSAARILEHKLRELEATVIEYKARNNQFELDIKTYQNGEKVYIADLAQLRKDVAKVVNDFSQCNDARNKCENPSQKTEATTEQDAEKQAKAARAQCEAEINGLSSRLIAVEKRLISCQGNVAHTREECNGRVSNCQLNVDLARNGTQEHIARYEILLKAEKDRHAEFLKDYNNWKQQSSDCDKKYTASMKSFSDADVKFKYCQQGNLNLTNSMEVLKDTVSNTNQLLIESKKHNANIQTKLTQCQVEVDKCTALYRDDENKLLNEANVIENLKLALEKCNNNELNCRNQQTSLRCEVDKILKVVNSTEEKVRKTLIDAAGIYDQSRTTLTQFVRSQDIHCVANG